MWLAGEDRQPLPTNGAVSCNCPVRQQRAHKAAVSSLTRIPVDGVHAQSVVMRNVEKPTVKEGAASGVHGLESGAPPNRCEGTGNRVVDGVDPISWTPYSP